MLPYEPGNQFPLRFPFYTHLLAAGNTKANLKKIVKCNLKESFQIHEFQNHLIAAKGDNFHCL